MNRLYKVSKKLLKDRKPFKLLDTDGEVFVFDFNVEPWDYNLQYLKHIFQMCEDLNSPIISVVE